MRNGNGREGGDSVLAFPEGLPLQYATNTRAGLTAGFGMGPGVPRRYGRRTTSPIPGRQSRRDCVGLRFDMHTLDEPEGSSAVCT